MSTEELFMRAMSDPRGVAFGNSYPDGTPKTNMEAYLESKQRSGQS